MNDDPLQRALDEAAQAANGAFAANPAITAALVRYNEAVTALLTVCTEEAQQTLLHLLTNNLVAQIGMVRDASRRGRGE